MSTIECNPIKTLIFSHIGEYKSDWVRCYLEPNATYSKAGGRITVNLSNDHLGSASFTHCSGDSFEGFIASVDADYLIRKMFRTPPQIDVESFEEFIETIISNEMLYRIKEVRSSEIVSKKELRQLYDVCKDIEFRDIAEFSNTLHRRDFEIMSKIFGEEWYYENCFQKKNPIYERQKYALDAIIQYAKEYVLKRKNNPSLKMLDEISSIHNTELKQHIECFINGNYLAMTKEQMKYFIMGKAHSLLCAKLITEDDYYDIINIVESSHVKDDAKAEA